MRRVLILTASYGSGHNEAARCVAAEVVRRGAEPLVVDHFRELVHPVFDRATRALYLTLLRRLPAVWGLAYALGDRLTSDSPLTRNSSGMTYQGPIRTRPVSMARRRRPSCSGRISR